MRRILRQWVLRIAKPILRPFANRLRLWVHAAVAETLSNPGAASFPVSVPMPAPVLEHSRGTADDRLIGVQLGIDVLRREWMRELSAMEGRLGSSVDQIRSTQLDHLNISQIGLSRTDISLQRAAIALHGELLMRTPEGFLVVPSEDGALVSSMWESGGRLEPGTLSVLRALLKPGDHVIDVGANIGLVSIPMARYVGSAGRVIAVEPVARLADLLKRSLAINGFTSVATVHQCAVGASRGDGVINLGVPVGHSSLLPLSSSQGQQEVGIVPLDDLVEAGEKVRLVKIDAEGFELEVWRGMQHIVSGNPRLVVLVEFGPEHLQRAHQSLTEWFEHFFSMGFTAYEIDEGDGSLRSLRGQKLLQSVHSLNLFLTRESPAAFPELTFLT